MEFSQLTDGAQVSVPPSTLLDFSLGNFRTSRDPVLDKEVEESIRQQGIIQPVVARPHPEFPDKLELLGGYGRRDKAARIGLASVPVLVRLVNDDEALAIHMIENTQRESLGIVDEAKMAQVYLTRLDGDREGAASSLGWSLRRLNERLELNRCVPEVLDAITTKSITEGHAIQLAPLTEKVQRALLDRCIGEGLKVAELREILGKVCIALSEARFDTSECDSCAHNTAPQLTLLDNTSTKAECARPACFKKKTKEWLDIQKEAAQQQYGTILYFSEVSAGTCSDVNAQNVGEEQYKGGCSTCVKKVTIMEDRLNGLGGITESQCTDKACFKGCVKSFNQAQTEAAAPAQEALSGGESAPKTTKKTNKKATKKPVSKVSSSVIAAHKKVLREVAASNLDSQEFQLAMCVAALAHQVGYTPAGVGTPRFTELAKFFVSKNSVADVQRHLKKVMHKMLVECQTVGHNDNATDFLIALLGYRDDAEKLAVQAWTPTKENLENYFVPNLVGIAESSGLSATIDATEGKCWKTIKGKGKGQLVAAMVEAGTTTDVSEFAPADYLSCINPVK